MRPTMLTVSNSTEQTGQKGSSYFPYTAFMAIYTGNVMETTQTTMDLLNNYESDQPKTTQPPNNLIGNYVLAYEI